VPEIGLHGSPDVETAVRLANAHAEPTLVVRCGLGVQAWHLFAEPWLLDAEGELEAAKEIVTTWVALHAATAGAAGYDVDPIGELARLLRLPGTLNGKRDSPAMVEAIERSGRRHERDQLAALCAELRRPRSGHAPPLPG
jgi:hypothetical protein